MITIPRVQRKISQDVRASQHRDKAWEELSSSVVDAKPLIVTLLACQVYRSTIIPKSPMYSGPRHRTMP